ncbi:hypothetical protein CcaverHIS631_0308290 [Cutaneotrichosporon cavernicola]|nr:hypothetical protein CcaverHIS631_0308290 [Cutaneotrichosporon cavernicola]
MSTTLDPSPLLVRASALPHRRKQDGPRSGGQHTSDGLLLFGGVGSIQDTPSTAPSAPNLDQAHMKRPSSSSTNFPFNNQLRSPPPPIGGTPSPSDTPILVANATLTMLPSSATTQAPPLQSPWHTLAASGGAMTPSLDGPSLAPRGSPQLRKPFEKLNLDGLERAWSASNLYQETAESTTESPRRASSAATVPSGAISGGGRRTSLGAPISLASSLAQRRAIGASMSLGSPSGQPAPPSLCSGAASGSSSGPTSSSSATAISTSTVGASTSRLKPLAGSALPSLLAADSTLVLDVRPPSCYQTSHLPTAHSITVPSMLMLRPAFGISKLLLMLSTKAREAVSRWRDKSDIVIVDQDSTVALEGGVLLGVSSKFEREGFTGRLWYVLGGQAALDHREDIKCVAASEENNMATPESSGSLGIGRLPILAFQQSSTGLGARGVTTAAVSQQVDPFQRLNQPLGSAPVTDRRQGKIKLQPANPFFDNIRQNLELSHGGISERIPLALPDSIKRRCNELPKFLRNLVCMKDADSQDVLANQFYRLERGEQERLQGVMNVLSKGCRARGLPQASPADGKTLCADDVERLMADGADQDNYFPFSITAGVERGTKNRYKNIWPFDYSRVRLVTPADDDSDYINASFVQPRGTARRYIATQGPLDSTYRDFWSLVWEQNVHVIVMLTRQFEGGLLKCGNYWQEQQYGDLHLLQVSHSGGEDEAQQLAATGFNFRAAPSPSKSSGNIHRTFRLRHDKYPNNPPRMVVQIQCVDWPDLDVPESPDVLLNLMKEVDVAVAQTGLTGCGSDRCEFPPVLVHCSAGVGRTGSYILVDAITDGLRRELCNEEAASQEPLADAKSTEDKADKMDVDATGPPSSRTPEPQKPRPITQSHKRHRVTTPLSSLKEPILEVLQGMRAQRMSLVQSLRQYLFVHRAIIARYLELVDEDARRRSSGSDTQSVLSRTSVVTAATSVSATDDDSHIKRKPSSADLQPEVDTRLHSVADLRLSDGATNLAKRASFKKRRGPNASSVPGTPHSARSLSSGTVATVTSPPLSSAQGDSITVKSPPSMSPERRRGRRE